MMPIRAGLALVATTMLATPAALAQDDAIGASFVETFTGEQLDRELWFVSDGWSNGSWHGCTWSAQNVRKHEDRVELVLDDTPAGERDHSCAELQTKAFFGFGTYEVRMRAAEGSGVMSAFFTYTGPPHENPHDEIDFEFPGARTGAVELNQFVDGEDTTDEKSHPLSFDVSEGFNDYAFEWTPEALRWYVNGELKREVTDPARIPQTPQKIYLNIFNGTEELNGWLGRFSYPGEPISMEIERVAYTAPGEECPFPESILCGDGPAARSP